MKCLIGRRGCVLGADAVAAGTEACERALPQSRWIAARCARSVRQDLAMAARVNSPTRETDAGPDT